MNTKPGGIRVGIDVPQIFIKHMGAGAIATNGVQYSAVVSFSTTATEVTSELVDPGYSMQLVAPMEVGLTQRLTGLNGSLIGTIVYYWQAREEYVDPIGTAGNPISRTGGWINISGTFAKATGTLVALTDTLSGYVPLGSIARAPVRLRLMAETLASNSKGEIKSSSYIKLTGNVIPGT